MVTKGVNLSHEVIYNLSLIVQKKKKKRLEVLKYIVALGQPESDLKNA